MRINHKNDLFNLLVIFFLTILGMLVFSCHTSPLYPNCLGYDSAIFSLLGKGFIEGKTLYTDLFDHKGPFIFFINSAGHILGGRNGIFLIQCVSILTTCTFLYYTGKILSPEKEPCLWKNIFYFTSFWSVFFCNFQSGNLTEEYSLPLISASCYFFIKYLSSSSTIHQHPPVYACFYGIAISILSLLRLNNAITICAGVLFIAIVLLIKKQYKNLALNLLAGLCGIFIVLIPVFVFFYSHDSLNEMIYATFIHNFKIALNTGRRVGVWFPFISIAFSFVMYIQNTIKTRHINLLDCFLAFILVFNLLSFCIANRFLHYFVLFAPIFFFFVFRYLSLNPRNFLLYVASFCICLNFYISIDSSLSSYKEVYTDGNIRYETVAADMERIPSSEKGSVIGYEIAAADYLAGNIIPCYKYYTLQNTWNITTENIVSDFKLWVSENEPLWLLVAPDYNEELNYILEEKYTYMFENPYMIFYRSNK